MIAFCFKAKGSGSFYLNRMISFYNEYRLPVLSIHTAGSLLKVTSRL